MMTLAAASSKKDRAVRKGRPESDIKRLSRFRVGQMHSTNDTPADIMLDNMIFYHRRAMSLTPKLEKLIEQMDPANEEDRTEALRLLKVVLAAREKSQACAVDLAPYVHPRLAALAIQSTSQSKIEVEGGLPPMPIEDQST